MKKKFSVLITLVILTIVGLLSTAGCRQEEPEVQKDMRVSVQLAPVVREERAKLLHTFGRLSSPKEIKLSFKIGGIIDRIFAEEGQMVDKGKVLARLNLAEIESQVKQARSAFEKAQRDFERMENLYKDKAATLEQYQNVQTALQVARSQLNAAEFNLRYAEIRAPSRGRILKKLMEENEMVGPGTPLFFFAAMDKDWIVRVGVSDRDLVRVQMNDPARVKFDAYPDRSFVARVTEIVEAADPLTGTFEVELAVDAEGFRLVSGFVAEVEILPSEKQIYAIIPVDALVEAEGNNGYVYTVNEETNTAKRLPVAIGFLFEDKVAISSGLENVENVITVGSAYVTDGTEVRIVENPR